MTTAPVTERQRAGIQSHADAVAGVVASAPHLDQIPVLSEITGPHFRIRLKAAAGEDHALVMIFCLPAGDAINTPSMAPL